MANLTDDAANWEAGVYQIETTDPVIGGAPNPATGAGMSNVPHLQLARRTTWLKRQVEALQNGSGYRSIATIAGNQTLIAADMGKCFVVTGSVSTITLPALSTVPLGSAVDVVNAGAGVFTILRAGDDTIYVGQSNVASIVVGAGRTLRFIRAAGASVWHVVSMGDTDIGKISMFAMPICPDDHLKANGALVSRTAYAGLFSKIGTIYGAGDGVTTFALPDYRGVFPRFWDDGRGVDPVRPFGSTQEGTFTRMLMNDYSDSDGSGLSGFAVGQSYANADATTADPSPINPRNGNGSAHLHAFYDNGSQAGQVNNYGFSANWIRYRPINAALLACIKYR